MLGSDELYPHRAAAPDTVVLRPLRTAATENARGIIENVALA